MKKEPAAGERTGLPSPLPKVRFFIICRDSHTVFTWALESKHPGLPPTICMIFWKFAQSSMFRFLHCRTSTDNILTSKGFLEQGWVNYSLWAETTMLNVCLNKVLLKQSQAHLFTCCVGHFPETVPELSSCHRAPKTEKSYYLALYRNSLPTLALY